MKKYNIEKVLIKDNQFDKIKILIDQVPKYPPKQCDEILSKKFHELTRECHNHFRNFFYQLLKYFDHKNKIDIGKLAVHNFKSYIKNIPNFYSGFELIKSVSVDYFNIFDLKEKEKKIAEKLCNLFEFYICNWKNIPIFDYEKRINNEKLLINNQILQSIKNVLNNNNVIYANSIYWDHPLSFFPFYFNVNDPIFFDKDLEEIILKLKEVQNKPSFYYLIPLYKNKCFIEGGYRIISTFDEKNFFWESLLPVKVPESIIALLPKKSRINIFELSFKNDLIECMRLIDIWKQESGLKINDKKNYFLTKLNDSIIKKYTSTFDKVKKTFKEFNLKYNDKMDELKRNYPNLNVEKIFQFNNELIQIDKCDEALKFCSKNFSFWKPVLQMVMNRKI